MVLFIYIVQKYLATYQFIFMSLLIAVRVASAVQAIT
jgi:hypothetical protein